MSSMDHGAASGQRRHKETETGFHWPSFALGLVLLLFVLAQGEDNGAPGYVGMAGLILLITGLYSAATRRKSWMRLTTPSAAWIVAAGGAVLMLVALGLRLAGL
ncbi:hypothetical protein [Arthrobacter caoxuetaonis]|uniref:Uncharacterized protein n=1 Tax=Arthrobacter caoxuetaonis TaxID=2886935 RepID=A0A9X1SEF0_9MICC|nr:hypothetical protein [Arthrobacter caoxuetaonis]MCC3297569.1 hypothetical protein [Arthrobacter caoxuetaonis]USQ57903.1 hypothetical protein NF551_03345 [Arthrobacter caoxuetaonis]